MTTFGDARRIVGNVPLLIGLVFVAGLVAVGVFGTSLAPYDPNATLQIVWEDRPDGTQFPLVPPTLPDAHHVLGTDPLGRDQWSRILAGAWLTLAVVLLSAMLRFVLGIGLGITAGWYGGLVAELVRIVSHGVAALPQLVLAILLVLVTRPMGAMGFVVSLALVGWPEISEFVAAESARTRRELFVQAARSIGARERRLARTHLLATLSPQLLTLGALEVGAVLLLLAELGIVGLFVAGATFFVGDFGPVGPLKGRVPEWGQMLGAIQFYAITTQLSTLLPAAFIVLAASAFTLLGDGLRAASDPHGVRRLHPATFGILTKVLTAALCFSAFGFVGANIRPGVMTTDEGRALSANTASATWPGSVLVAVVARYRSPGGSFGRPETLTYYYRRSGNDVLRITYLNGERLATEVREHETLDEIDFSDLRPLPSGLASYDAPASYANEHEGGQLRADLDASVVRAIVTWPPDRPRAIYTVTIGSPRRLTIARFCCMDALTGEASADAAWKRLL